PAGGTCCNSRHSSRNEGKPPRWDFALAGACSARCFRLLHRGGRRRAPRREGARSWRLERWRATASGGKAAALISPSVRRDLGLARSAYANLGVRSLVPPGLIVELEPPRIGPVSPIAVTMVVRLPEVAVVVVVVAVVVVAVVLPVPTAVPV